MLPASAPCNVGMTRAAETTAPGPQHHRWRADRSLRLPAFV